LTGIIKPIPIAVENLMVGDRFAFQTASGGEAGWEVIGKPVKRRSDGMIVIQVRYFPDSGSGMRVWEEGTKIMIKRPL
jgi:hypothetical protein